MTEPRTQKVRGVQYLEKKFPSDVPVFRVIQSEDAVEPAFTSIRYYTDRHLFARPCPLKPRHGFVDSQPVQSSNETLNVFRRAREADPNAEMLLMPFMEANLSAILTPSAVSVGRGHDGVTGKGNNVITLPLAHANFEWVNKKEAGITNTPYIESVTDEEGNIKLVQLRDGPAVSLNAAEDGTYIPRTTRVQVVIKADGDLLKWETRMKRAGEGTVVTMPGGSMLSHYAVHAVLNHIPVVFDGRALKRGDRLKANVKAIAVDYSAMARGLTYGLTKVPTGNNIIRVCRKWMRFAAVMAHQATALTSTQDGAIALGVAVGYMLRCAAGAARAEARHVPTDIDKMVTKGGDREAYYYEYAHDYLRARVELPIVHEAFEKGSWHTAFGGKRWGGISGAVIALDRAANEFLASPSTATYTPMLASLHTLLNAIHNGASWVTKFIETKILDRAANGHIQTILSAAYSAHVYITGARNTTALSSLGESLPPVVASFWRKDEGVFQFRIQENHRIVQVTYGTHTLTASCEVELDPQQIETVKALLKNLPEEVSLQHPNNTTTTVNTYGKTMIRVPESLLRRMPQKVLFKAQNTRNDYLAKEEEMTHGK